MKKYISITLLLLCTALFAEDYQYQYFTEKNQYVPFSDYIPRVRLHYKTVPHYVEDFYELYGMKQYYNENSLRMNINRLNIALTRPFRHPSQALCKLESDREYYRYRNILFMHINILIMRDQMKIAARYDRHNMKFYDSVFAKEIRDSLDTAEKYYTEAIPYWEKARQYAHTASTVKVTTDLGFMETERFRIIQGDLDYGKIIKDHLNSVSQKKIKLDQYIASSGK